MNSNRNSTLIQKAMFTGLFEGATSSRATLYYNNLPARVFIPSTLIYTKYVYQEKHLEEDTSRSGSFYQVFLHLPYSILLKGLINIDLYYIRIYCSTYVWVRTLTTWGCISQLFGKHEASSTCNELCSFSNGTHLARSPQGLFPTT